MGMFGFLKKKNDFDFGSDLDKEFDKEIGKSGFNSEFGTNNDPINSGVPGFDQNSVSQPSRLEEPPSFNQQNTDNLMKRDQVEVVSKSNYGEEPRTTSSHSNDISKKEFELIAAKLDTIKIHLENLNQRVYNIEVVLKEEKKDPWK